MPGIGCYGDYDSFLEAWKPLFFSLLFFFLFLPQLSTKNQRLPPRKLFMKVVFLLSVLLVMALEPIPVTIAMTRLPIVGWESQVCPFCPFV